MTRTIHAVRDALRAGRVFVQNFLPPDVRADHRAAVGGLWDVLGPLQFEFMRKQGLQPSHRLLDIGCGSLRAGRLFIPYLDRGCYMGFDLDETLVRRGLAVEVAPEVVADRQPQFAFNASFEFPFSPPPHFAIAQSVFTHLTPAQIHECLGNLHAFAPNCTVFATFNESPFRWPKWFPRHTQRTYFHTRGELAAMARRCGWTMTYIGDWGHPRDQRMVRFTAARAGVVA